MSIGSALGQLGLWAATLLALPGQALAFSAPSVYAGEAEDGGGGGRWFTGSPAEGFACSACHTGVTDDDAYPLTINGVPFKGYELGQTYGIVLDWPEFAARWSQLRPDPSIRPAVGESPAVGLLAEFVPESGQASGTVEILATVTQGPQLCEMSRPTSKPRLGASLFQVRPGVPPIEIEPNADGLIRCEARQLGQRCLIAVSSCGAHQVQLRWTPPDTGAPGPIWFSAGLVASEVQTGTPEEDSVYEFSAPMVPKGSPSDSYEAVLEGAPCSVASVGAAAPVGQGRVGAPLALLGLFAAVLVRAGVRRRARRRRRSARVGPRRRGGQHG